MINTLFILLKKTFIVPVLLIVAVSGLVASLFTKIAGILGGFIWLFLGIFAVMAIFFRQWPQLMAAGIIAAIIYFFIFFGALISVILSEIREMLWKAIS